MNFYANPNPLTPLIVKRGESGTLAIKLGLVGAVGAVGFTAAVGADSPWLTVAPSSGSVALNAEVAVTCTIATAALSPGTYRGTVTITQTSGTGVAAALLLDLDIVVTPRTMADLTAAIADRIQDAAGRLPDLTGCALEALRGRFSKVRPQHLSKDLTGNGVLWKWALNGQNFPGWAPGFSIIEEIETPADQNPATLLERDDWLVYRDIELHLVSTPANAVVVRVYYTALQAEDCSTVPDADFDGLANLAASLACQRLAAIYAQSMNSAIGGDAVDQRGKQSGYLDLAKVYEERFKEAFGLDKDEEQPAATATAEWKQDEGSGGWGRLTH